MQNFSIRKIYTGLSLSGRILSGVMVIVIVLGIMQAWNIRQMGEEKKEDIRTQALEGREALIEEVNRIAEQNLNMAQLLSNMDVVRQCIISNDRSRLFEEIKPMIDNVNRRLEAKIKVHFHLPPGISFLRVWKPTFHGQASPRH